jgi:hypothetical protein
MNGSIDRRLVRAEIALARRAGERLVQRSPLAAAGTAVVSQRPFHENRREQAPGAG